jgi:Tetratricopeptide repeat
MNNNITKRIHINPQSKGSLGKSFEAEFRTAWLDYHDIHWNGSDLDDRHHSFADRHPEQVQSYVLGNDDDSKSTLLGLFRNVSRSDAPVHIVDCRAQADGLIVQALESLQLLESLATQGIRFTFFLFPSEDTESMNNLLDLFYFAGDRVDYVIVHNPAKVRTSHPDAARLSNILNKNVNTCFAQQAEPSSGDVSALAAESYHEAGTVLYTMGRFEEAVKMVEKAVKCQPGEGKYYFFIAKYLTRLGKPDSAVPQLQKAIELVPEIALATIGDFDLNRSQITLDLLETLNNSVNSQLTCGIQRLEKWSEANSRAGDTDGRINS